MVPEVFQPRFQPGALADLRARLTATRWPDVIGPDDWTFGVPQGWLRDMCRWWADEWDPAAVAADMERFDHYRVEIDGVPLHFVHAPSERADAVPLILTHGWPWTFWDYRELIEPLREHFHVVVPSLPGFGFSVPLRRPGVDVSVVAELWVKLMVDVLGYERFAAHGGDWGALVTGHLGHAHAGHLYGVHLTLPVIPGVNRRSVVAASWADDEQWMLARMAEAEPLIRAHVAVHTCDPQTLAYAMADSPAGTAAWIWERRRNWSDCEASGGDVEAIFDRTHLCTTAALYWLTGAFASSVRLYAEHFRSPWPLAHDRMPVIEAPTAMVISPKELVFLPRSVVASHADLRRWTVLDRGGHFAAPENPAAIVADLRAFFLDDLA
jgi:hypothetical protein